jgi:hypothetical protein
MNKPSLKQFLKTWAICPKCKKMFDKNSNTTQPVTNEYCMHLQLEYYCSGKTQPVTEQDYLQL